MSAAGLPELRGEGGPEPGVQTHNAPGPGAAPGQGGGPQLRLPPGVTPHRGGLHLREARRSSPAVRTTETHFLPESNLCSDVSIRAGVLANVLEADLTFRAAVKGLVKAASSA